MKLQVSSLSFFFMFSFTRKVTGRVACRVRYFSTTLEDNVALYQQLHNVRRLLYKTSKQERLSPEECAFLDTQVQVFEQESTFIHAQKMKQLESEIAELNLKILATWQLLDNEREKCAKQLGKQQRDLIHDLRELRENPPQGIHFTDTFRE